MEESEVQASMKSVEDCISVLQGDLHQPGTPAIVLKLTASWQKLHHFLTNYLNSHLSAPVTTQPEPHSTEDALEKIASVSKLVGAVSVPPSPVVAWSDEEVNGSSMVVDRPGDGVEMQPSEVPPAGSQDLTSEPTEKQCSAQDGVTEDSESTHPGETASTEGSGTENHQPGETVNTEGSGAGSAQPPSTGGESSDVGEEAMGDEYQKVDYPVLYYHKTTGYYYDPSTQQFFAPTTNYQSTGQGGEPAGEAGTTSSLEATTVSSQGYLDGSSYQGTSGQGGETEGEGGASSSLTAPTVSSEGYYGTSNYQNSTGIGEVSSSHTTSITASSQGYYTSTEGDYTQQQQVSGASKQPSIADVLAAASDRVVERCGYEYNEGLDMFYDANSGLYYHQESQLYYDADLGCYYQYDYENKKYSVHSRVALPETVKERNKRSSSPEFFDPLEEGEIRLPHLPQGSPPPEEEWAPCVRAVVSESEKLPRGTLFVVTQDGACIGREPTGRRRQSLIKIPELKISKVHAVIFYDKHEKSFMVKDLGSVNGTFLNKDQRLCEPRESSHPWPLVHGHTLTLGSTTLVLHIHNGWETCNWCDPSSGVFQSKETKGAEPEMEIGMQRKRELNRIKKKYGLRMKDTYGEELDLKGYCDRSETRRRKVGSDVPESQRPDDAPSSVDRPIDEQNIGRKMLKNMGWKGEGGLGKTEDGIAEPVRSEVREERAGLGSVPVTLDKIEGLQRLQKRYHEVVEREKLKKQRLDHGSGKK